MLQRGQPYLSELILNADDAAVDRELDRRVSLGKSSGGDYNVASCLTQFQGIGVRWGESALPQHVRNSPWLDTLSPYHHTLLKYSYADKAQQPALLADISQSMTRLRYSKVVGGKHISCCVMPAQLMWVDRQGMVPRLLLGGVKP